MRRKGTAGLLSIILLGLVSFGFGSYFMISSSSVAQGNPSYTNQPILSNTLESSNVANDENSTVGTHQSSSPIISVSLTAGAAVQPNGTTNCLLITGFDSSSCVSTSTGRWVSSFLSIEINSSLPTSIAAVQMTNNKQLNVSTWSDSPSYQTVTFQGLDKANFARESHGSELINLYPVSNLPLMIYQGEIYSYKIALADGQVLPGSVAAQ